MHRTTALKEVTSSTAIPAGALAVGLAVVAASLGWRGADTPNYLFRIDLFRRAGFTVWSSAWYGGHYTLGYSALLPPLGAALGPAVLGVLVTGVAAVCFALLVDHDPGVSVSHRRVATLLFAAGTVTNLAVGRMAFALGLAIGLAGVLAGQRGRPRTAILLSVATALASPLAGAFLALAWTASALASRNRRASLVAAACCAAAVIPVVVMAVLFPEGGTFPFRGSALLVQLAMCAVALLLVPDHYRSLRIGFVLYGLAGVGAFLVPTPLGGNVVRLGMYVAAPVLVAVAPRSRRTLLLLALPWLLVWQWTPALDGMFRAGADPSTTLAYYQPLTTFIQRSGVVGRIEIPFTRRHFETAYVAEVVPLARGWERQIDIRANPLFYAPGLDADDYHRWLVSNGVQFVALPDAPLDSSAVAEAAVVTSGQSYLAPVWHDAHWRVWRVIGSPGIVSGPAVLVAQGPASLAVRASGPGSVLVRVRWTASWSVAGPGCVEPSPDGWTRLQVRGPGRLELQSRFLDAEHHCPP